MIESQSEYCGWIGFWLIIQPFRQSRWSGLGLGQWKNMGFLQRRCHNHWLQSSCSANQNDRVSAQATFGLIENPQNNGLIPKLNHYYWLELSIPEWVSLEWPMRGLLTLILWWRGISFVEGHSKGRGHDSMLKTLKIEKRIHQFCWAANCTITFRWVGCKLGLTFFGWAANWKSRFN